MQSDDKHDHKAQASRPGNHRGSSGSAGPSLSCDRNLPTPQSSVIWWAQTLAMVIGYLIFPRYRRKLDAEANRQREAFDASCD